MIKTGLLYGYLNLLALPDSLIVEFEGDDGIFIPFRANPSIFVSDRSVNLRASLRPLKGRDVRGNTHAIFASSTKDLTEEMSEDERKILLPYLGKFYPVISVFDKPEEERIISGKPVAKRIVKETPPDDVKDEYSDIPF